MLQFTGLKRVRHYWVTNTFTQSLSFGWVSWLCQKNLGLLMGTSCQGYFQTFFSQQYHSWKLRRSVADLEVSRSLERVFGWQLFFRSLLLFRRDLWPWNVLMVFRPPQGLGKMSERQLRLGTDPFLRSALWIWGNFLLVFRTSKDWKGTFYINAFWVKSSLIPEFSEPVKIWCLTLGLNKIWKSDLEAEPT